MLRTLSYFIAPSLMAVALLVPMSISPAPQPVAIDGDRKPTAGARSHPLSDDEVAKASSTIDRLVSADLASHGQKLNPPIDDYTFLRRACLQIIGRIPTVDEANAFLSDTSPDRRKNLIARLGDSAGWVHNEYTWWADLLRISTRLGDRYPGNAYVDWIKESLRANKPYDQIVHDLITAEGPALARGNGATGYYLRDAGMPLDNMANTVQVFLGTRIQCAQCHDHPFDKWTRKEFYELAAYTNSVGVQRDVKGLGELRKKVTAEGSQELKNALRIIGNTIVLSVHGGTKANIPLPHDYQYKDAKPDEVVSAKTIFGEPGMVEKGTPAKQVYADWLTSTANPRFTTVIANRMWKRAFGLGLVEPVDNFTDTTVAANPELLAYLSKLMVSVDYDLKRFARILYQTDAWQRAATSSELSATEPYRFPGPVLRRLSAEQMWDSLLTLSVPDLDSRQGESAERLYKFYEDNKDKNAKELYELAQDLGSRREKQRAIEQEFRDLRAQLEGIANKDSIEARRARARIKELQEARDALADQTDPGRMIQFKKQKVGAEQFVRADELPSPAPQGHFLRTFGQSDRDVIEASSSSPATTQALTLLNGFIDRELLKERSVLFQEMLKPKDVGGKVEALFLACLTRKPSDGERELGKQEIAHAMLDFRKDNRAGMGADVSKEAAKAALHNLAWVLLNSNEFMFLR
jgi:hypothetical protein